MYGSPKKSLHPLHFLIFILVLGTVLLLAISAAARFCRGTEPSASPPELPTLSHTPESVGPRNPSAPEHPAGGQTTQPPPVSTDDGRINLLLIGQDSREPGSRARSDTMILCSLHPGRHTITLISFLRDLYVQIPGHSDNRLNAAYAFGGMPLLKETFTQNFGLRLDGCMEVDFQRFVQLVDLMGGIQLDLRQDEAQFLNQLRGADTLTEGVQQLDGEQALAYVRIRNLDPDGDFSRTLRQRKLLTALLEQLRKCSVREALSLIGVLKDLVSTDLTKTQIASYAATVLPFLSGAETTHMRIPADGTYYPDTIDGMAVLIADPLQTKAILQNALEEP